ncbi:HET-domain-containing protein [Hypoxylon sp. FL1284]|nr:HET-domain-containing protein [Hypoxylon sp. FL1284]
MASECEYRKLPSSRYIRVLQLHNGKDPDEISCELVVTTLDEAPEFEALSYVWGDFLPRMPIRCSGRAVEIGPSLHGALRHLRQEEYGTRTLWVDALCINQKDMQERNKQVRLMGDLYRRAAKTIIWLGEDPDNQAWRAFQIMEVFDERLRSRKAVGSYDIESDDSAVTFKIIQEIRKGDTLLRAITELFERQWFSRKWIIQELVNSKYPVVKSGAHEIPWHVLEHFSFAFRKDITHIHMGIKKPGTKAIHHLSNTAALYLMRSSRVTTLTNVIYHTLSFSCTQAHDHIIGILGLLQSSEVQKFDSLMRYDMPESEQWRRYIQIALEGGDLEALVLVDNLPLEARTISWVPDIAQLSGTVITEPIMFISRKSSYSDIVMKGGADGSIYRRRDMHANTSKGSRPSVRFEDEGTVLVLEGVLLDRLDELTSIVKPNSEKEMHAGSLEGMGYKCKDEKQMWYEATSIAFRHARNRAERLRVWEEFTRAWLLDFDDSLDVTRADSFIQYLLHQPGDGLIPDIKTMAEAQHLRESLNVPELDIADTMTANYYFCRTTEGRLGWVAPHSQPGDVIYVVLGSKSPHVFRPQDDGTFKLIGQCYIQ